MKDIIITKEYAIQILQMEDVCCGEGIGPDTDELLKRIHEKYPELEKGEYERF